MESIKIENLRCFKNTDRISLKPLTIAVGKNSSGKSTLLRVFPLLKQTMETKLSEPILWYGRYVDFGEFLESKSKFAEESESINFEFEFIANASLLNRDDTYLSIIGSSTEKKDDIRISVKLYITEKFIRRVDIDIFGYKIEMLYHEDVVDILIDGKVLKTEPVQMLKIEKIIPTIQTKEMHYYSYLWLAVKDDFSKLKKENELIALIVKMLDKSNIKTNQFLYATYIFSKLIENLSSFDSKKKKIRQFLSNPKKNSYNFLMSSAVDDEQTLKQTKQNIDIFMGLIQKNKDQIVKSILVHNISKIVELCNMYLSKYFKNIKYIAPVRATAQRYYRKQGLDIQEVDSRGENVTAVIQGMKPVEKKAFALWLQKNFGFNIHTELTGGHISLYIESQSVRTNIADTGFGYSQILPIILMLWKNEYDNKDIHTQIVIEQPELHLHPKMQLQLMDLILKIISSDNKTKFLIETHSEKIINYIGEKIEQKQINSDDVEVLLIQQNENKESNIKKVNYTPGGYLEEWPIDFF